MVKIDKITQAAPGKAGYIALTNGTWIWYGEKHINATFNDALEVANIVLNAFRIIETTNQI